MHALYAKDQLRQRMAWALAQIYVIRAQHDPEALIGSLWLGSGC